jgi:DNA-binding MarR family transcriptional regulator
MSDSDLTSVPPLLDRVSFLMHRINAHLMRHMNPRLKVWDVDLTESRLLVALLEMGPLTAGDLVRIMALPQSTVSHQIKRLEKRGYVTRSTDARDSRVIITQLTAAGSDIAHQADQESREVTQQIARAFSDPDELAALRVALKRLDATFTQKD